MDSTLPAPLVDRFKSQLNRLLSQLSLRPKEQDLATGGQSFCAAPLWIYKMEF